MSTNWSKDDLHAASNAMNDVGEAGYGDFCTEQKEQEAKAMLERFAKVQRKHHFACPRCGRMNMADDPVRNAVSRYAQVMICDTCGIAEAIGDYAGVWLPLGEWSLPKAMIDLM